jgi:hypothetical protein
MGAPPTFYVCIRNANRIGSSEERERLVEADSAELAGNRGGLGGWPATDRGTAVEMSEQGRRRAQNEAKFRTLNEEIKRLEGDQWSGGRVVDLVCECSSTACMKVVTVPRDEYETVRASSTWFLVAPGHEDLGIEGAVARHEQYVVVEKHGEAAAVAEETDPRE